MTQPEPSTSVGLPPPKRHRWVPTVMVSCLTAKRLKLPHLSPKGVTYPLRWHPTCQHRGCPLGLLLPYQGVPWGTLILPCHYLFSCVPCPSGHEVVMSPLPYYVLWYHCFQMAWQAGTSLWIFGPNLRSVILVYKKRIVSFTNLHVLKKRNWVVKIINLLINCGGVTSTTMHQVFVQYYLIISTCTLLSGLHCPDTHGTSMGSCPLAFPVGQLHLDQISFAPLSHPQIHHRVNISGNPTNVKNHLCLADL